MSSSTIFYPLLVQIGLTLFMFILLAVRKAKAVKSGGVDRQKAALDNSAWNIEVVKVSNNIANQFQAPVLFYILTLYFSISNNASMLVIVLCWIFAVTRIIHAFVHVTSNFIPARLASFTLGVVCLIVLTAIAFTAISPAVV